MSNTKEDMYDDPTLPSQPSYAPPPYNNPPPPPQQTNVVILQPQLKFGTDPVRMKCTNCNNNVGDYQSMIQINSTEQTTLSFLQIVTKVETSYSWIQWAIGWNLPLWVGNNNVVEIIFIILFRGGCGCCLIPFCIEDLSEYNHGCPNCNANLGKNKTKRSQAA